MGSPAGASAPLHGVTGPWPVGTSAAGRPQSPRAPIAQPRPTRNFSLDRDSQPRHLDCKYYPSHYIYGVEFGIDNYFLGNEFCS